MIDESGGARSGATGGATPTVHVVSDADALARAAAGRIVAAASEAVAARGRFTIALAGGTTPAAAYRLLAGTWRDAVPWAQVVVYFGDERCVPPDDPASNYGMARAALLDHVPVPPGNVRRIRGELGPTAAAAAYDAELRAAFGAPGDGAQTFDLALLGVGEDGHTASLFPGAPTLDACDRWAVAAESPDPARPWPRVTLTLPALCGSGAVMVLAAGAGKRWVVEALGSDDAARRTLPATRVAGRRRTLWLVDAAAGGVAP